jgi:1-acyl-sn-glycerol-3-phosphate acyltransferase
VFPEGTTTGATLPAPFPAGVFRVVQRLDVRIVPITVRYSHRRAYWVEDLGVWQHLKLRVLTGDRLRVVVHVGEALHGRDYGDFETFAATVYAAVCRPIETHGELA